MKEKIVDIFQAKRYNESVIICMCCVLEKFRNRVELKVTDVVALSSIIVSLVELVVEFLSKVVSAVQSRASV